MHFSLASAHIQQALSILCVHGMGVECGQGRQQVGRWCTFSLLHSVPVAHCAAHCRSRVSQYITDRICVGDIMRHENWHSTVHPSPSRTDTLGTSYDIEKKNAAAVHKIHCVQCVTGSVICHWSWGCATEICPPQNPQNPS